jgi:glycosyltransferase involved in cell wall biosynthesis
VIGVGVVIPTLNAADHIEAALRSVLEQDPPPIEVVVVDGGSTDGTQAIVTATSGVRLIQQRSRGLGAARNEGIDAVRGHIIGFCDADDRWAGDSLAIRLRRLLGSGAGAVIGAVCLHTPADEATGAALRTRTPVSGYTPGALLAWREALSTVGPFASHLRIGCDSEWFIRLTESSVHLEELPDVVLHKAIRPGSLSTHVGAYRTELLTVARAYLDRRRSRGQKRAPDRDPSGS